MSRQHSSRPYSHEADMYDDSPRYPSDQGRSSPRSRQDSRQDQLRLPRGQEGEIDLPRRTSQYFEENKPYEFRRDSSRSPHRESRRRYNDRDREDYRSPDRSRSGSPYYGAPPSRTVILEGLPLNMTQEDILKELQQSYKVANLEEIRLIRDKKTGLSRQFAFAQFVTVESARQFLERNYPSIQLFGPYDPTQANSAEGTKVRVAFSREKEDRDRAGKNEDDWKCDICYLVNYSHRLICFRCNGPRTRPSVATGVVGIVPHQNMSSFSGFATTGDSDVSPDNTASQFLLLRGLEPGVTEELMAKGVAKLYKVQADPPEVHVVKKTKITSTSNDSIFGAKEGSLRRVLLVRDRKSNESWRYGFAEFATVEDAQGAMAKYNASEKFTIASKPVLVSYIHAGVFVPVLQLPSEEFARFTFSPLTNPSVKLMYWDEAAYANELVTAKEEKSALAKAKESVKAKLAAAATSTEGLVKEGAKKRKAEKDAPVPSTKKVVAPHLQFWTNRHAELHGLPAKDFDESSDPVSITEDTPESDAPPSRSYADLGRKCCLLCSRQFKTEAEVHKHERVSQLHRDNMQKEELVSKALTAIAKTQKTAADADAAYRDRARERRQAFNQPKQPAAQHNKSKEPIAPKEEAPPAPSKGAALLGKMGWTAGEGLGAQGTGMKEAISTELYTQGVGLGAEGGRIGDAVEEANRSTKGSYADFVNKSKDKAKERYERMG